MHKLLINITTIIGKSFQGHQSVINKGNMILILILLLFSCSPTRNMEFNSNKALLYDRLSETYVYTFVEQMPQYKNGYNDFTKDFHSYFHYTFKENDSMQTKLSMGFVVDSTGHLIAPRIQNKRDEELTGFERRGIEALKQMQSWKAGKQAGKNVNVLIRTMMHIDLR